MNRKNILSQIVPAASKALGSISGILSFLVVMLVSADVILRAIGVPIRGVLEISRLTLGWICFFSLVYTYMQRQHVRVTLLTERLPKRWRRVLEVVALLLAALLLLSIFWKSIPFFVESWRVKEVFNVDIPLPYWLAKLAVFFGTLIFGLACLTDALWGITKLLAKERE